MLHALIYGNFLSAVVLFLNNMSGLQSPSLPLLIGHPISQSRGLKLDVYHINSKSLAGLEEASKEVVEKNAPDATMMVPALKPLSPSQPPAVQEEMKPSQGSRWEMNGHTQCLLVVLELTLLKAGPIHLPAVVVWGVATTGPWKKGNEKKGPTKGKSIHPNGITQRPRLWSDTIEHSRVMFCNARWARNFHMSNRTFLPVVLTFQFPHLNMLKSCSSL